MPNELIDFTHCEETNKTYGGANGSKICVKYNNELYMLKFPPIPSRNKKMSYANSCISEYIGCHIFESVGIDAQQTLLGKYTRNEKTKIVVACKDFTLFDTELQDFASHKNKIIDSDKKGYGTELDSILYTINNQSNFDKTILLNYFWDMFIIDAFIGNFDRHNGNWGFIRNRKTDELSLAPVFDCGSCLYPQLDIESMNNVIDSQEELNKRVYEFPLSIICENNKKINYHNFISSLKNDDCNAALKRIFRKIDTDEIENIIDDIPTDCICDLQKDFYKKILKERKEKIIDYSYKKLIEQENKNRVGYQLASNVGARNVPFQNNDENANEQQNGLENTLKLN